MFTLSGQIGCNSRETLLTLSRRGPLSYRNQSIDLLCKSMDWFLYDNGLRHERVKNIDEDKLLHKIKPISNKCMFVETYKFT